MWPRDWARTLPFKLCWVMHLILTNFLCLRWQISSHYNFFVIRTRELPQYILSAQHSAVNASHNTAQYVIRTYSSCISKTYTAWIIPFFALPITPAATIPLSVPVSLAIFETSYKWNHVTFCDWFIALTIMSYRFFHAVALNRISFFFIPLCEYTTFSLPVHLCMNIWILSMSLVLKYLKVELPYDPTSLVFFFYNI
jgi:hypothetical protein